MPADPVPEIDVTTLSIGDVKAGLKQGRFTAQSLLQAHLDRIAKYEPYYNAFTFINEKAMDDAKAIDAKLAAGEEVGLLAGVPLVVKEAMDQVGFPSTAGWKYYVPSLGGPALLPARDAPVVARVRNAGALLVGRTNIPAFSYDGARASTSWKGPTFNAAHRGTAPGASSSGTATAVAAAFSVVGLAEETGGSIQNPAAAQSLVSVKPTFALVPNAGVVPIAGSTRDVVGPHARNVVDAAILMDVLAGYTPEDPKTVASIGKIPVGGYTSKLSTTALSGARLGTYGTGWRKEPLDEETAALYAAALEAVKARGAVLVDDPFAGTNFASLAKVNHGFDGRGCESIAYDFEIYLQRLGPTSAANSFKKLTELAGRDPFADGEILDNIRAHPVVAASLKDPSSIPDLAPFLAVREEYLKEFNGPLDKHDLAGLVFPQTYKVPPGVFGTGDWPATTVSEINIAGIPAVTVPAGKYTNGAPFSLLFVGRMWSEADLLAFAYDYEQATHLRVVPEMVAEPFVDGTAKADEK